MKGLGFWFVFLGTLFALVGMAWGIQMSISGDHSLSGAHAHNNLIGWVTMTLYGLFYAVVPTASQGGLAKVHFGLAAIGALLIGPGIAMAITGQGEIVAVIASFATILGMAAFAVNVWLNRA